LPTGLRESTRMLGLGEMSVAIDAWQSNAGPESHSRLTAAFEGVIRGAGLSGGHFHLNATPLTEVELSVGVGPAPLATAESRSYKLSFGDRVLATLRLDAPPAAVFSVDECARASRSSRERRGRGPEPARHRRTCRDSTRPLAASPESWTWTASCS
jgi:hypothetical protein